VLSRHAQNAVQDGSVAGLDSFLFGKATGLVMQDLILITVTAFLIGVILIVCFRQLKMTAFDPGYATSVGVPAGWLDRLLLSMTVGAVVAGLPMLGVVLVAALTIIPAITARFLTYRLNLMIPTGPTVILVAGSIFLVTLFFAKDHGIVAKAAQRRRLQQIAPVIAALRGQPANDVARKVMRKLDVGEPGLPNANGLLLLKQWEEGSV
jgi:ABC-type Mn2+/Zn2+ transport system permease subunit